MNINKVTYIENGYFNVLYNDEIEVFQDITAIKMQVPSDPIIKDILLFLRKIKLEKLMDNFFDETVYRNHIVYEYIDEDFLLDTLDFDIGDML